MNDEDKYQYNDDLEADVVIHDTIRKTSAFQHLGHPSFPNKPYPGYSVDYATCSAPTPDGNTGCDAWAKCTTKGQGPYAVAFINPAQVKTSCHCRDWMRRLQFRKNYRAVDNEWEPFKEHIAVDPSDKTKGYRVKTGKIKILNVKNPDKLTAQRIPQVQRINPEFDDVETSEVAYGDRGTDHQVGQAGQERPVGDQGNRKGRPRAKGHDEGSGGTMPGQERAE